MGLYNRLNPAHWLLAFVSNSRKSEYLRAGTLHVDESQFKATQRILYWFRNPAHDFTHYVIGFKDEPEFRTVYGTDIFKYAPGGGWIFALRRYKYVFLPYISYSSDGNTGRCIGWSSGGAFKLLSR